MTGKITLSVFWFLYFDSVTYMSLRIAKVALILNIFLICVCEPGIIKQDPELSPDKLLHLPPRRPKNAIFEDEEKSKVRSFQAVIII